jgi:hypothetical protein
MKIPRTAGASPASARESESGQTTVLLLVALGVFLLGSVGFAVDLSNIWFHRQAAQTAADAACVAGAMDMRYLNIGTISVSPSFVPGTAGDCSSSPLASLCQYAGFNGYTANTAASGWTSSTAAGSVAVNWTFPTSVTGVSAASGITYPFLRVVVQEKPLTWFMGLLGLKSMAVGASCTCGLPPGPSTAPIVVLNPLLGASLSISGGAHIVIVGGPTTSIQVNSVANLAPSYNSILNAVYCSGGSGYPIDTSLAGPSGTGGNLAIAGGPTTNQYCGANYILNTTTNAQWKSPSPAVADPYGSVPAPSLPTTKVAEAVTPVATSAQGYNPPSDPVYGYIYGTWVASGTDSCPNTASTQHYLTYSASYPLHGGNIYGNCLEFNPGYYPLGIDTTVLASYANDVVIFMPGVYYMGGNLNVGSSTTIRNAWVGTQPSTAGVMFYFLLGGPTFAGGSGAASASINSVPSYYMNCSSTTTPSGIPATLTGNLLVSQCAAGGTFVGSPSSDTFSTTGSRGLLFYLSHTNAVFPQPLMGAGATLSFGGAIYYHNLLYTDLVTFNGAGASNTYAVGNMVVDLLALSGSGTIAMNLTGASTAGPPLVSIFQ